MLDPHTPFTSEFEEHDMRVVDFWQWSQSNLLDNNLRGHLAEFIVGKGLGLKLDSRVEWDSYDLLTPDGIKVEVKSAAYVQSWVQKKPSTIRFGIAPTKGWNAETNKWTPVIERQSDVYVFCLLAEKDKTKVDPLNLDQWEFYLLRTSKLNEYSLTQKTIGLSAILKLGAVQCDYHGLASMFDLFRK